MTNRPPPPVKLPVPGPGILVGPKTRAPGGGRPPSRGATSHKIDFRVTPEELTLIDARASAAGVDRSTWIRRCLGLEAE